MNHGATTRQPVYSGNRRIPGLYERTPSRRVDRVRGLRPVSAGRCAATASATTKTDAIAEARALQRRLQARRVAPFACRRPDRGRARRRLARTSRAADRRQDPGAATRPNRRPLPPTPRTSDRSRTWPRPVADVTVRTFDVSSTVSRAAGLAPSTHRRLRDLERSVPLRRQGGPARAEPRSRPRPRRPARRRPAHRAALPGTRRSSTLLSKDGTDVPAGRRGVRVRRVADLGGPRPPLARRRLRRWDAHGQRPAWRRGRAGAGEDGWRASRRCRCCPRSPASFASIVPG